MLVRLSQHLVFIFVTLVLGSELCAQTGAPTAYQLLRYQENYRSWADSSLRNPPDRLQYIGLGSNPDTYLTLGGDMRQAFEYFRNQAWTNSGNNAYWLQRYRLLADLHVGTRFRWYYRTGQ